jgi:hypothetical protein
LLLPLTTNLFVEAAERSAVLERRGFGSYKAPLTIGEPLGALDAVVITASIALPVFQLFT